MVSIKTVTADATESSPRNVCTLCGQGVPFDEVTVPETIDYLMFFCGLACYQQWRRAATAALQPAEGNAP